MKQIILFGGSFDPVHDGHINMAKKALDQRGADELWFIPTQVSPFKSKSTDFHHRLAMLNFRCAEDSRFKVCDIEGKEAGPSYTIKTVLALEKDYPDMNITVSADSKVLLETEKLIKKKDKKGYRKKINKIKSIEKEQT